MTLNPTSSRNSRGFTLIELLICLGLIMILTLGINQVFSMATNTIGMGNRVNEMSRTSRTTVSVLQQDISKWATDSPICFIQNNYVVIDNPDGSRKDARRADVMGFFSRGEYRRMTSEDRKLGSSTRSTEAWTWIGHCNVQDMNTLQWKLSSMLGRQVILLKDENLLKDLNTGKYLESFIRRNTTLPLSPLNGNSTSLDGAKMSSSRYDLAGTTIEQFRADLAMLNPDYLYTKQRWFDTCNLLFRYECVPTPRHSMVVNWTEKQKMPIFTSSNLSKGAPVLMDNCSDFIIDFPAVDHVTQNANGAITAFTPDGIMDYPININSNDLNAKVLFNPSTQWRGMDTGHVDGAVLALPKSTLQTNLGGGTPADPLYFVRGASTTKTTDQFTKETITVTSQTYLWVNGNGLPKNVRISFRQTDPEGRIQVGPWTQFTAGPR